MHFLYYFQHSFLCSCECPQRHFLFVLKWTDELSTRLLSKSFLYSLRFTFLKHISLSWTSTSWFWIFFCLVWNWKGCFLRDLTIGWLSWWALAFGLAASNYWFLIRNEFFRLIPFSVCGLRCLKWRIWGHRTRSHLWLRHCAGFLSIRIHWAPLYILSSWNASFSSAHISMHQLRQS